MQRKKGNKFENKVQKSINSGALWFNQGDLRTSDYCIECKITDKKGFRITRNMLEKLYNQSLNANKLPKLIIGISRNDDELFIVNCDIQVEGRK